MLRVADILKCVSIFLKYVNVVRKFEKPLRIVKDR